MSPIARPSSAGDPPILAAEGDIPAGLWVPGTSSTSCDQAVFVDHAADAGVSSDTVLLKIDRFIRSLLR
jgi:hypothetical protein